jgi:intracellular sulfur oxidation DsrE/DsrF family protein
MVAAALAITALAPAAFAFNDAAALKGIKDGKIIFDVTAGSGKALLGRLKVIDETRDTLIKEGVTPYFILTFRGKATELIQSDLSKMAPKDRRYAGKIAAELRKMGAQPGIVSLQQCSVAVREQHTNPAKVIPPVKVVGNAFVSLMAYEQKGYAYIQP